MTLKETEGSKHFASTELTNFMFQCSNRTLQSYPTTTQNDNINKILFQVEIMLNELKNSLAHLVGQAKWMDDNTKLATYQKIIQMKSLIGFPDWLLEEGKLDEYYEGIEIQADNHLENMIVILQAKVKKQFDKFHDVHNVTWATEPTEVNAYHTFQQNTISKCTL